jgi:hypothetical protein
MRFDHRIRPRVADFVSAKTSRPIPHAVGLVADALLQASLNPEIIEISFLGTTGSAVRPIVLDVVTLLTRNGWRYLDIEVARPLRSLREADAFEQELRERGLAPYTLTGADIVKEPRFTTARAVWTYRRCAVSSDMRVRLLAALADDGPMSLHQLCTLVPGPLDPFAAVLSLACSNELEIDLSGPLGPTTILRSRS